MDINEYEKIALSTLMGEHAFGDIDARMLDQVLGLTGEAGEVADKFKKIIRDRQGKLTDEDKLEIVKELGDVLWYVTTISHLLGYSLEDVARKNNEKLLSRKSRDQLRGSGDNR